MGGTQKKKNLFFSNFFFSNLKNLVNLPPISVYFAVGGGIQDTGHSWLCCGSAFRISIQQICLGF
jgi:hypothetical protein